MDGRLRPQAPGGPGELEALRPLLESTDDYILICDAGGLPVAFNSAYAAIMREALGIEMRPGLQPHRLLEDPEQVAWWDGLHRRVLAGEHFRVEYTLHMPGAPTRHLELSYSPIFRDGRVDGFCEVTRDITDRRRTEVALLEREFWLEQSQRAARIGTYSLEIDAGCWQSTAALDDIFGIGPAYDRTLEGWATLVHPEDRERVLGEHHAAIRDRGEFRSTYRIVRREDGVVRWVEDYGTLLPSGGGRPERLVGCVQDVTQRRDMEREVSRTRNLQALGTLAGGIAHDFNNLLAAVFGNLELAQLAVPPGSRAESLIGEASRAAVRARNLTGQLLGFARGGLPRKEPIRIGPLLKDSTTFVLSGSNVDFRFGIPEDLWVAELDPGQFDQVMHNLVRNAREVMPAGGLVRVSARNLEAGEGAPGTLESRDRVEIVVSDTGPGIPAEHLDRVFDPYFTTKARGEGGGTGLGLSICHTVIEKHGGEITAANVPGGGARFTIVLPASRESRPAPGDRPEPAAARPGAATRVLVMDDDPAVLRVVGGFLRHLDCEGVFAASGEEAVARYAEALRDGRPFGAVLLDLTVRGGMGGAATLERLRGMDPEVRALLMTGYTDDALFLDHRGGGFAGALAKPFTLRAFSGALRSVLPGTPPT